MKKIEFFVVLISINLLLTSCESEERPESGYWSGDDISFTVSRNSKSITDFSCKARGNHYGYNCSMDYVITMSNTEAIPIVDNSFSMVDNSTDLGKGGPNKINGYFIDTESASITFSWEEFSWKCGGSYSGDRTYSALSR